MTAMALRLIFLDDLSVSGNVTVDGESFIATHTTNTDSDGVLNLGRNNNEWETIQWDDSEDRFAVSGNLDLTHTGVVRITLHDGVRRSDIHFDTEEYGFHMDDSLSISDALTVWNGYISSDRDLAINPGIRNARILELGGTGESDTVLFEAPATTVSGYLSVSSDVTVDGIIYGSSPTNGTEEDRYIIDTDDTTDTPTVAFEDGSFDETLRWNDLIETFELSDDLSIAGELSIAENMLFFRNGAAIDLVESESMHFNTNLLTDTDLTVSGDLTVLGASATRIRNGRVEVGDGAANTSRLYRLVISL